MYRSILAGGTILLLAACATEPAKAPAPRTQLTRDDCYTVKPYKPLPIEKPKKDVPDIYKAFAGKWVKGAWDGYVCHDLVVMDVDKQGDVTLFDAHGPGFGYEATGFTRKGKIDKNGHLTVRKGDAMVDYWIVDGKMHGIRREGEAKSEVILIRPS